LQRAPGYYNEAEKVALLRRAKRPPHDELLVDFHGSETDIALKAAGIRILEGAWSWNASAAGQALTAIGNWQESCWHRDWRCDYLELELTLNGGWRLERQMLLARRDRFLYLADAFIGPFNDEAATPVAEIRHTSSLPLARDMAWSPARQTREGWLADDGKRRATIIPPATPEWRAEFSHGQLHGDGNRLALSHAARGRTLYAPLWIDLDPKRLRRPITWRKLTVAENREIVPRNVAVAYRVQAGSQQWLFYRSFTPRGNRTFLGQNYASEFACCRFLPTGEAEEIIAIDEA
jgi:hypothetical protein